MLYYLADKWKRSRKVYPSMNLKELNRYVKSVFQDVTSQNQSVAPVRTLMEFSSIRHSREIMEVVMIQRPAWVDSMATHAF